MCRLGAKKIDSSSRPCTHMRWMVTSVPILRVAAEQQAQTEVRPGVDGGVRRGREQGAQVEAGILGAVHDLLAGGLPGPTSTGGIRLASACPMRWVSSRGGQSSSMPTRSRLAISPTSTRQPG